jgi:hypothetical protein
MKLRGPIGSLQPFLGSLGAGAGETGSHQTDQNLRWHFVWWPGSHPDSQNAHVDWMLAVSVAVREEHTA